MRRRQAVGAWHGRAGDAVSELLRLQRRAGGGPTDMTVAELSAFADEALAGLAHRRLDFELVDAADARRAEFEARGWSATRLLWMRPCRRRPAGRGRRSRWSRCPTAPCTSCASAGWGSTLRRARRLAATTHRRARSRCAGRGGPRRPRGRRARRLRAAPARRHRGGRDRPGLRRSGVRGGGRGTALTCAAIRAAGDVDDCGSAPTTRPARRISTRGSAFAPRGRRWSSRACSRADERVSGTQKPLHMQGLRACAEEDSNLHGGIPPQGPQPCASTNSATGAGLAQYRRLIPSAGPGSLCEQMFAPSISSTRVKELTRWT